MKIPNIFHFCFGFSDNPASRRFDFMHYLAIRTAWQVNSPEKMYFYFKHAPTGYWWQQARPYVTPVQITPPESIFGNPLLHYAHQADVVRLEMLLKKGGIYLDIDVVCVKNFSPLRHHECVMGIELPAEGLCNAVILAEPNSRFLARWYEEYRSFRSRGRDEFWGEHSVLLPARLAKDFPQDIHIEGPRSFFYPSFEQPDVLWSDQPANFEDSYCIHLWETLWQDQCAALSPRYLRRSSSNFARLFREYGHDTSCLGEALETLKATTRHLLSKRRGVKRRLQKAFVRTHAWLTFAAYRSKPATQPVVVDVGAVGRNGRRWLPGWGGEIPIRTVDLFGDADIQDDATTLATVADNSLDGIYTSHLIEHVWWWKTEDMLGTWFDKLKPGGRIEIRCPDFEWIFRKALRGGRYQHVWEDVLLSATYGAAVLPWSQHMGDPGQIHRNVLWAGRLLEMLERAGFVRCRRIRYWRAGYDRWPYDLKYKDEHGRHVVRDLVVEAFKPLGQVKAGNASRAVFSDIYRSGAWAGEKNNSAAPFYSGPGSDDEVTLDYREFVARFIAEHGIKSVVDIGCGDFRVARHWVGAGIDYVGVDVVPELIEYNRAQFGAPNVQFLCADAATDSLPAGDLCLVRQVLQHMSNSAVKHVLKNVGEFRHVLVTEHYPAHDVNEPNIDIMTGQGTRVDIGSALVLDAAPFNVNAKLVLQTQLPNGEFLNTFLIQRPDATGN